MDVLSNYSNLIIAITTVVYAVITGRMLYETKKMRESQTEPCVFINVQPMERARFLKNVVIQNIGHGPAYNLRFKVEPDKLLFAGQKLSDMNIMKNGLKSLAPNQKIEFLIANSIEEGKKDAPTILQMSVNYDNGRGKSFEASFTLDVTEYFGMMYADESPYKGIVDKLDAIQKDMHRVIGNVNPKVRVVAYTKSEILEEEEKLLARYRQATEKKNVENNEAPGPGPKDAGPEK